MFVIPSVSLPVRLVSPGIGYATQVIEAHLNVYYVVILAWAIFYLFNCFTTELPWAACGHYWNTGGALSPGVILMLELLDIHIITYTVKGLGTHFVSLIITVIS